MTVTVTEPWRPMKWWGWGDPAKQVDLPASAIEMLKSGLGVDGSKAMPVRLEAVRVNAPRLPEPVRQQLAAIVGADAVREDQGTRVVHAAGKGYPDLIRMRTGVGESAPDAIVYPASALEVWQVIEACARNRIAVVPFGGGTSVVGGVEPIRGAMTAVISLDLARMIEVKQRRSAVPSGDDGPRPARTAGRGRAGRAGHDARPLPAVVRVRDRRRLGRDALGRPGLDRLRPHRRAGRRACAASPRPASWPCRRGPPPRPDPTSSSCWSAARARSA